MTEDYFDDQIFLLSCFKDDIPELMFHGYCFVDADYIYGQQGAQNWELEKGVPIRPGDDGCYAVARKRGRNITIGSDAAGNKKIFYYWQDGVWAVSNSLYILAKHLQAHRVRLHPNTAQILFAGYGRGPYSFLNQLISFETPFRGIKLLPVGWELMIGVDGADLAPLPSAAESQQSYGAGLEYFIRLWIRRMKTLIACDQAVIACDLTGGQDSRAVFSLLNQARAEAGGYQAAIKISCGYSPGGSTADIDVARAICESAGFELNGRVPRSPRLFNPAESYQSWKQLCLGSYWPVYFPNARPWPWRVALGGGGGENYRAFYTPAGLKQYLDKVSTRIENAWYSNALSRELEACFEQLERAVTQNSSVLIEHYRNFRNRFHSGRTSQYSVLFSPLMSTWLDLACRAADGQGKIREEIVNYDVIYNSSRTLLKIPFDHPKKNFDERKQGLVSELNIDCAGDGGGIFVDERDPTVVLPAGSESALQLFVGEYEEARQADAVQALWGRKFLESTSAGLSVALENKRLGHAIDGQAAAAVIASSVF